MRVNNNLLHKGDVQVRQYNFFVVVVVAWYLSIFCFQVQYSPRRTPDIGLTDGEGVERFWSYLRQFSTITKEMSVDKRNDVLTDSSLHYGEHLMYRFGNTMSFPF